MSALTLRFLIFVRGKISWLRLPDIH